MFISKDLTAASVTPLVLSILLERDSYGYSIIKKVKELSADQIQWTEGMLYPVLHRLEKQQQVSSYWQQSAAGRKRRYYRITEDGKKELLELKSQWQTVHSALDKSWGGLFQSVISWLRIEIRLPWLWTGFLRRLNYV